MPMPMPMPMRHGAAQAEQDGTRAIAVIDLQGSYDHAYVVQRFHSAVKQVAAARFGAGAVTTAFDMAAAVRATTR